MTRFTGFLIMFALFGLPLPAGASAGTLPQATRCNGVTLTQNLTYQDDHHIRYDIVASAAAKSPLTYRFVGTVHGVIIESLPLCPNGRTAYRVSVLGNFAKQLTNAKGSGRLLPANSIDVEYDDYDTALRAVRTIRCGALQQGC